MIARQTIERIIAEIRTLTVPRKGNRDDIWLLLRNLKSQIENVENRLPPIRSAEVQSLVDMENLRLARKNIPL